MAEADEATSVSIAEGLVAGEVGGGAVMVGGLPATVTVIGGGMGLAMRNRIGIKARHCFNFGQSCTVSMWLWLQVCAGTPFTCFTSSTKEKKKKLEFRAELYCVNVALAAGMCRHSIYLLY
jgi:tetrahydromethanopterin S-methyltransferase subunit H